MRILRYPITLLTAFGAIGSYIVKVTEMQYDDSIFSLAFLILTWCLSALIGLSEQFLVALRIESLTTNTYWLSYIFGLAIACILDVKLVSKIFRTKK